MNREDRAKQFAPFDALKGLREALREKEIEHERQQKKELSDEDTRAIQERLAQIKKGDELEVTYFKNGYYVSIKGVVLKIDTIYRYLQIGDEKIFFDDILKL